MFLQPILWKQSVSFLTANLHSLFISLDLIYSPLWSKGGEENGWKKVDMVFDTFRTIFTRLATLLHSALDCSGHSQLFFLFMWRHHNNRPPTCFRLVWVHQTIVLVRNKMFLVAVARNSWLVTNPVWNVTWTGRPVIDSTMTRTWILKKKLKK